MPYYLQCWIALLVRRSDNGIADMGAFRRREEADSWVRLRALQFLAPPTIRSLSIPLEDVPTSQILQAADLEMAVVGRALIMDDEIQGPSSEDNIDLTGEEFAALCTSVRFLPVGLVARDTGFEPEVIRNVLNSLKRKFSV